MDIDRDAPVQGAAEAEVAAPREVVWEVQTDLERWPEWNSGVRDVRLLGPMAPGTAFKWKAGGLRIASELREVDPPRRIAWTGRTVGLRAVHVWSFEESGEGTRLRTEESFRGWLAHLFPGRLRRTLTSSLEQGLAALALESERRVRAGPP